jgi:4-amino-4-deoxy-L-arabinose transferase-like glycosyltransferase
LLAQVHLVKGLILFLAITVPWHYLMAQEHPEFLNFYFIHEHFTRFLTSEHRRTAPWWFFIAVTWAGLMPWSGLLPSVFKRIAWREPNTLFLLLWTVLPLAFFSSSHSKLVPYIFPIFPPLCILLGQRLWQLWEYRVPLEPLRRNAILVIIVFAMLLLATQLSFALPGKLGIKITTITSMISFWSLVPMLLALVWLFILTLRPCPSPRLIGSLLIFGAVTGLSLNFIAATFDKLTVKPLASELLLKLKPLDMVVAYGGYWQDLPVYLNRNITVARWTGELSFGVEHYPETRDWMIAPETFWKRCALSEHAVYVFINSDMVKDLTIHSNCRLKPMASYGKTILMKKEAK